MILPKILKSMAFLILFGALGTAAFSAALNQTASAANDVYRIAADTADAYQPPAGIPAPDFGIDEQRSDYYARPEPWNQETAGWYYIDQYHASASDGRTYGTPDNPRQTIPDLIPAGSVVEIHGAYDFAPTGYDLIETVGTPNAPVFIVGDDQTVIQRKWVFQSAYTIIENIEFTDSGKVAFVYPTHHTTIRNCELHHLPGKVGGYGNSPAEPVHHIVIYNNQIHSEDGWNQNPDVDLDHHGIKFDDYAEDIWILDNLAYHNGGDFIQVGNWHSPADNTRAVRFYIGGNTAYANRQGAIGVKQSSDVIISGNHFYDNQAIQTNAAGAPGIGFQYGPERLWIINNHIHDSNFGISSGSNSGGTGQTQYIIGNLIHDIHAPDGYDYNVNTPWSPAAIMLAGGVNRYVINNTIYDADAGINHPGFGPATIHNNIIYNVSKANHVFIEHGDAADISSLYNNVFYQGSGSAKIRWRNSTVVDVSTFESLHPSQSGGNLEADPIFVNNAGDYHLQADSPAKDAGIVSDVYQTFFDLYGLDISVDRDGVLRPQGMAWDIGAYEFVPALILTAAPGNQSIRLAWEVSGSLAPTATWQIDCAGSVGDQLSPITNIANDVRAYELTGLDNYVLHTIILKAMLNGTAVLTATTTATPTDIFVHLPLIMKQTD